MVAPPGFAVGADHVLAPANHLEVKPHFWGIRNFGLQEVSCCVLVDLTAGALAGWRGLVALSTGGVRVGWPLRCVAPPEGPELQL